MNVYPVIIVGTDGSKTATEAVERAALLAERLSTPLLVASVYHRTRPEELGPPSQRAQSPTDQLLSVNYRNAAEVAADGASRARGVAPGIDVDTAMPEGDPAEQMLELAEARPGCLVVVGSQGMTGSARFLLGSIPNKVSHHAVGDVLIARTGEGRPIRAPETVLVATDGSETASRALRKTAELAAGLGAAVTVLCVDEDAARAARVLDDASEVVAAAGVQPQTVHASGEPAEQIVASGQAFDLVVVGNKGMTGAGRFLLGSIPNKVSHHATTDLLIVKTTGVSRP